MMLCMRLCGFLVFVYQHASLEAWMTMLWHGGWVMSCGSVTLTVLSETTPRGHVPSAQRDWRRDPFSIEVVRVGLVGDRPIGVD